MTNKQKKDWARTLFLRENISQKEIAQRVDVTEATLSKWVNDPKDNWERLKSSIIVTKEEELRRIYMQITELNSHIFSREEGTRFANSKEADTLSKLATTARQLETEASLPETIEVFKQFLIFVKTDNLELAQAITHQCDAFIKHKLK